jgi:thiosulfate/3-mercaptopyruvate sulfurtransferase
MIYTLDWYGLGEQTQLLDGGFAKWKREGRAVTTELAPARVGTLSARQPRAQAVANVAAVQAAQKARGKVIIDARAPVFYSGPPHMDHRAGHIPGAVNIPFTSPFTEDLTLRDSTELTKLFADAGIKRGDSIIAYCHIGQQATAVVFAARALGYSVQLYDGSFEDWSRRKELPTEGGTPGESPSSAAVKPLAGSRVFGGR